MLVLWFSGVFLLESSPPILSSLGHHNSVFKPLRNRSKDIFRQPLMNLFAILTSMFAEKKLKQTKFVGFEIMTKNWIQEIIRNKWTFAQQLFYLGPNSCGKTKSLIVTLSLGEFVNQQSKFDNCHISAKFASNLWVIFFSSNVISKNLPWPAWVNY